MICRALTADGFGELCGQKRPSLTQTSLGWVAFLAFSVPVWVTLWAEVAWWSAIGCVILTGVFVLWSGAEEGSDARGEVLVWTIFAAWLGTGIWRVVGGDFDSLIRSHGIVLLVLTAAILFRLDLPSLFRSTPLLVPLALLALLLPLLTAETWKAAAALDTGRIVWLAVLMIVPVAVVLYRRLLANFFLIYADNANRLSEAETVALLHERIAFAQSPQDADWLVKTALPEIQERANEEAIATLSQRIAITLRAYFARSLARRLVPTALALGVLTSAYLYVLAAVAVDRSVAAEWSGVTTVTTTLDLGLFDVVLPVGVYIKLAALMGLTSTAIYLALVLTNDEYSATLTDALLHEPAYRSLALGVPYLLLSEPEQPADRPEPLVEPPLEPPLDPLGLS
jgi:hypothetical protein